MNRIKIYLSMLFMLASILGFSQCNEQLIEKAVEFAGSNAIYIRDFKVKLSKGNMDNPNPTGKFPIYLNKGVNYRFSVANASEDNGKANLELIRKGQVYGSNIDQSTDVYINSFDFDCHKSGMYRLYLNFGQGQSGCAAVVISMVVKDSMAFIEPSVNQVIDSTHVLYLWQPNKVQIATTKSRKAEISATTSQGIIESKGKNFIITPDRKGELQVNVEVFENDSLIEKDSILFHVIIPPLPSLEIGYKGAGAIHKRDLGQFEEIYLGYPEGINSSPYKLVSFSISDEPTGYNRIISDGNRLSYKQIELMVEIKEGKPLYFHDVIFEGPDGKMYRSPVFEMTVYD